MGCNNTAPTQINNNKKNSTLIIKQAPKEVENEKKNVRNKNSFIRRC